MLDALPISIPVSLEWPAPKDSTYTAEEWAMFAIKGTQRFLSEYEAALHEGLEGIETAPEYAAFVASAEYKKYKDQTGKK